MLIRIYAILFVITNWGCKTSGNTSYLNSTGVVPIKVMLTPSSERPSTDSRPTQYWLHPANGKQSILATRKSNSGLTYTSGNSGINQPVSISAQQCMDHIFRTIEKSQFEKSIEWKNYSRKYPYRFLEILPELQDFYTSRAAGESSQDTKKFGQWLVPVLWNGFKNANISPPGESGFKVRGYIKWRGALLSDGKTCLIARSEDIARLLQTALKCEDGEKIFCNFRTEKL